MRCCRFEFSGETRWKVCSHTTLIYNTVTRTLVEMVWFRGCKLTGQLFSVAQVTLTFTRYERNERIAPQISPAFTHNGYPSWLRSEKWFVLSSRPPHSVHTATRGKKKFKCDRRRRLNRRYIWNVTFQLNGCLSFRQRCREGKHGSKYLQRGIRYSKPADCRPLIFTDADDQPELHR